jgi:hypothetical protein
VASLDAELPGGDGGTAVLADALPELNALQPEEQALLKLDLDRALAQLTPRLREVLIARFPQRRVVRGNRPSLRTHRIDHQRLGSRRDAANETSA